jgi:hypothetical protein
VDRIITRINCAPVEELTRQHLVAEYRELPRIFNLVRAAVERGERPDDKRNPRQYTLGAGHCRFFYPRLGWLKERQRALVAEMQRRGYNPAFTDVDDLDDGIPGEWLGWWTPGAADLMINRARISERLGSANREAHDLPFTGTGVTNGGFVAVREGDRKEAA